MLEAIHCFIYYL